MQGEPLQSRIDGLVRPDQVHQDVYTDPEIFELEMDRIFGRAWIYVGHESQVPNPGDFWTTLIGRESVAMVRDKSGAVHVLRNRCPHKGAKVVPEGCGNAGPMLRCPYHAWTFNFDGSLLGLPHRGWYDGTGFDPKAHDIALRSVARVDSVHGFVFASLSEEGPDLRTFLGGAIDTLDLLAARSPEGRLRFDGGVQRVWQESNWKLFLENMSDTAHALATHESSYSAAMQAAKSHPEGEVPLPVRIIAGNGRPSTFWESLEVTCYDYGHSYFDARFVPPSDEVALEHRAQLVAALGEERADQVLGVSRHNTIIYPSCSPRLDFHQMRIIRPISVNRTLVEFYSFRLVGTSDRLFQRTISIANVVNSPSSVIGADDIDVYRRCQEGMESSRGEWISHHRDAARDARTEGGAMIGGGVSELPMRNQFRAWKQYMERPAGKNALAAE